MMRGLAIIGLLLGSVVLGGCDTTSARQARSEPVVQEQSQQELEAQIAALTDAIIGLGPNVDQREAERAARISVLKPLDWAREWQVVDPPLAHNIKVVHGLREKGVCQDWADAMEIALHAEGFRTLDLHRGLANMRNIKLEHATVIISARGQTMDQGLILDPWRIGQGRLYYGPVLEDERYVWETRESVWAWKRQWKQRALSGS